MFKSLTSNGRILVAWSKLKSNCKRWSYSPLSTLINSWNLVCNHLKVFCFMVLLDVVKLCLLRQSPTNAAPTLSRLKVHSYWLCGLVRVRLMLEMYLIRLELPLLVSSFSMSWIPLQSQEALLKVMLEELVIELLINCLQKWMV